MSVNQPEGEQAPKAKSRKGFASMSPERMREIASAGGKSAHAMGRAHRWTSEEASEAGKKGGAKTAERVKRLLEEKTKEREYE